MPSPPHYVRVALALALVGLGTIATSCTGGVLCTCNEVADDAAVPRGSHHSGECTPVERDAGCLMSPGVVGPLPPPELA